MRFTLVIFCVVLVGVPPPIDAATDAATKPILRLEFGRHTSEIVALSVDSSGRLALTASRDSTARLWDLQRGQLLKTFRLPIGTERGDVTSAALSPDGKNVVIGMESRSTEVKDSGETRSLAPLLPTAPSTLFLFKADDGKLVRVVESIPWGLGKLEYSPDGRWLAAGCFFNGLVLLETSNFGTVSTDKAHYQLDPIQNFAFSADGHLATTSGLGFIRRYAISPSGLRFEAEASLPGGRPQSLDGDGVAFSPDGNRILVAGVNRQLANILDSRTLAVIQSLNLPEADTTKSGTGEVAWLADGRPVAAGRFRNSEGRYVALVWPTSGSGEPTRVPLNVRNTIFHLRRAGTGVAFSSADPKLGVLDSDLKAVVNVDRIGIDLRSDDEAGSLRVSADGLRIQFQPFGGGSPWVFDVRDRALLQTSDSPLAAPRTTGVPLSPWKNRGGLKIKDIPIEMFRGESVRALAIDLAGKRLVVASGSRLRAFDLSKYDVPMPKDDDRPLGANLSPQEQAALAAGDPSVLSKVFREMGRRQADNTMNYFARKDIENARKQGVWNIQTDETIVALNIPSQRDVAIAGYADGTIRWHRLSDGAEVLALFVDPANKRWMIWSPSGYFDSSLNGADLIGWHVNRGLSASPDFFSASQFWDVFYRPDIVQAAARQQDVSSLIGGLTIEQALLRPPPRELSLKLGKGVKPDSESFSVDYQVRGDRGGIGEIRLFLNGKLIHSDGYYQDKPGRASSSLRSVRTARRCNPCTGTVTFEPIRDEKNEVSIVAFNADNSIQSQAASIEIRSALPKRQPKLWIFSIGINTYDDNTRIQSLKNARKDAEDFTQQYAKRAATLFGDANVQVLKPLLDGEATHRSIMSRLDEITQAARPEDTFVWFIASHGLLTPSGQFSVVTTDAHCNDPQCAQRVNLLTSNDFLEASKKIRSMHQLVILDTCHAGGLDNQLSSLYDARMFLLARNIGLHVYASAQETQDALDGEPGTNGLFTRGLLKGLQEGTVDSDRDGYVSILELGDFARAFTIGESKNMASRGVAMPDNPKTTRRIQIPVMIHFGSDAMLYKASR